jgi:hypothetical protein
MNPVILNGASGANMSLIVELAKKLDIAVMPLEDLEDRKLLQSMLEARKEGLADRETVLKKLGL